jgi:predicted small lipoprotein YifL
MRRMNRNYGSARMATFAPTTPLRMAAALLMAAALAGCGVRGNLEPPPEAKAAGTATSAEAADPGSNSVVKPKPHKPFVLDGLLR